MVELIIELEACWLEAVVALPEHQPSMIASIIWLLPNERDSLCQRAF
jgi:hypothetical protein